MTKLVDPKLQDDPPKCSIDAVQKRSFAEIRRMPCMINECYE